MDKLINWQFHKNDTKTKLAAIDLEMKDLILSIKKSFLETWKKQSKEYHKNNKIKK